jgi:hypothetical protein
MLKVLRGSCGGCRLASSAVASRTSVWIALGAPKSCQEWPPAAAALMR